MNKVHSKIRKVEVKTTLKVSLEEAWRLIEDVDGYTKYVKFMKKAWLAGVFAEGNNWVDISTLMFLPLKISHQIIKVKKRQRAIFLINLPFGGRVLQTCTLTPAKNMVELSLTAEINWNSRLLDLMFGKILEKRTKEMFEGTQENFQKKRMEMVSSNRLRY